MSGAARDGASGWRYAVPRSRDGTAPQPYRRSGVRICVVTVAAHGLGGMQRHTHDLVRGLSAAGHEVELIAPRDPLGQNGDDGAVWRYLDVDPRKDRFGGWLAASLREFREAHAARALRRRAQ